LKKVKVALIGGTGMKSFIKINISTRVGTPYGPSPPISFGELGEVEVVFLPRHGEIHEHPPHMVNYRANIWALHSLGVERILATSATGAVNPDYNVGDLAVLNDFLDFTTVRPRTFYDKAPVTHIDLTDPFCPELRGVLVDAAGKCKHEIWVDAVYVCMDGPRYETPAEIKMLRSFGGDLVGMTVASEAILARELEVCYASLSFVSNMAAGMQKRIASDEVVEIGRTTMPKIQCIFEEAVKNIPKRRSCRCSYSLEGARL
jgi:5'-methylthioadenosine phosphorylase